MKIKVSVQNEMNAPFFQTNHNDHGVCSSLNFYHCYCQFQYVWEKKITNKQNETMQMLIMQVVCNVISNPYLKFLYNESGLLNAHCAAICNFVFLNKNKKHFKRHFFFVFFKIKIIFSELIEQMLCIHFSLIAFKLE